MVDWIGVEAYPKNVVWACDVLSESSTYAETVDAAVNRLLLYDLAHDGVLVNEVAAREGPCKCFTLASGKLYCWDKGIVGALDQDQIATFCPPEKRVAATRTPQGRFAQFAEASQECEIGKTYEGSPITNLQDRIACMTKAASTRGIQV